MVTTWVYPIGASFLRFRVGTTGSKVLSCEFTAHIIGVCIFSVTAFDVNKTDNKLSVEDENERLSAGLGRIEPKLNISTSIL